MIFIYTTCATVDEAEYLGKIIVEKKLASCVDYWAVDSMFYWENKLKKVSQVMIMITTFEPKFETVNDLISEHHSYSVPIIGGVDISRINRKYKEWMISEIK